jgi:hypothetical protein
MTTAPTVAPTRNPPSETKRLRVFKKTLSNGHPSPTYWWKARIGGRVFCRSTGLSARIPAERAAAQEVARLRLEAEQILEAGPASPAADPAPAPAADPVPPPAPTVDISETLAPTPAKDTAQPELFTTPAPPAPRVRLTEAQAKIGPLIAAAAAGSLPWLAQVLADAGYHRGRASALGASELAAALNVSRQTVHTWTSSRGCPAIRTPAGGVLFDPLSVAAWLYARSREDVAVAERRAREAGNDAKRRDDEARADLRELDLAQRRGAVVETDEHWRILLDWAGRFVAAFRARPAAWATALQGATAATIRGTIERDLGLIFDGLRKPTSPANIPPDAARLVREALEIVTAGTATPPAAPENGPSPEPPPPPAPAATQPTPQPEAHP